MRIFLDTEFEESYGCIKPISIALVPEVGVPYYAEFEDYHWDFSTPWLLQNVKPKLTGPTLNKIKITDQIVDFCNQYETQEFWAYFATTDFYVFYTLFGPLMDFPKGWPKYIMDLKSILHFLKIPFPERLKKMNENEHNALSDAQWLRYAFDHFVQFTSFGDLIRS
jgi:hypothetical protein